MYVCTYSNNTIEGDDVCLVALTGTNRHSNTAPDEILYTFYVYIYIERNPFFFFFCLPLQHD